MERYPLEFYHALGIYLENANKPSFFHRHPTTSGMDIIKFIDSYIEDMEYCGYKTKNMHDALSWKSYIKMNIFNAVVFSHAISVLLKMKLCK